MSEEIMVTKGHTDLSNVFSNTENFQELFKIGKMFASSGLVPQSYQNKPMDCTIAVDMANRMNISPMFIMQNLYVVQGKPSWSGQACTSMIMASSKFRKVRHVYTGERNTDTWGCHIEAERTEGGEVVTGPEVTIKMAKDEKWYGKSGSKWQTMPELMLAYRAAAFFARVYIPNALMGCSVEGEMEDIQKKKAEAAPNPFTDMEQVKREAEEVFE